MEISQNEPFTRLSGKEYSPMVLRRYSTPFLHWVGIITDDNLDKLDEVTRSFWESMPVIRTIQEMRNACGLLQEKINTAFPKIEGSAVIFSADKMLVSSLYGDFMVHEQCRLELYQLLNLSTQI